MLGDVLYCSTTVKKKMTLLYAVYEIVHFFASSESRSGNSCLLVRD